MSWSIVGTGAVTSNGRDVDEVFTALCDGHTGLAPLRGFDTEHYRTRFAYEIDDRPTSGQDSPMRATAWLLAAIAEAARSAGLGEDLSEVPILIGTGLRELRTAELGYLAGEPIDMADMHFGNALRRRFGAAETYTFCNACSASLYALALGTDLIEQGGTDTVIVAGIDSITESMFGLLDRVNSEPPAEVRPFDKERKGVLLGEGAAAVVVRRPDAPGASPLAVLRSVGINCDAYHVTAPDPSGIAVAIRDAHARAGVKPDDIDLVLLHGTGTVLNDQGEAEAMNAVYGPAVSRPVMTAIKSLTGHTSGGSGLLALVVATEALRRGRVPATAGLADPIEEAAAFRFAARDTGPLELSLAQVNAFGFGGVNAVAVVEGAVG